MGVSKNEGEAAGAPLEPDPGHAGEGTGVDVSSDTVIWTNHLRPGEQIVWSAAGSPALRHAELARARLRTAAIASALAFVALLSAWRFYETFRDMQAWTMASALGAPVFLVFAITFGIVAAFSFARLGQASPAAQFFAATNQRMLAADASGQVVDEIAAADVDQVIAGGRTRSPDIFVLRKDDDSVSHAFSLLHLERPLEAKAIIEQTFLEPAP